MYDFTKFIEVLNSTDFKVNSIGSALDLVKDDLFIGKIEINSSNPVNYFSYVVSNDYENSYSFNFVSNSIEYKFYPTKRSKKANDDYKKDINLLLRIIGMYYNSYLLKKINEEIELLSLNTKLYNVHGFIKKIKSMASEIDASKYNSYYINLKGFGLINKLYDTQTGDKAIVMYAERLKEFACSDELVGHLGGDNFVAFIKRDRHEDFIKHIGYFPIEVKKNDEVTNINLVSVIGYYEIVDKDVSYSAIISNPAIACQYGRNNKKLIVKLTPELVEMVNSIKNIERTFNDELNNGKFIVYYQPKFDMITKKIVGVEALSRWVNNDKMLTPDMFVPILEKNGEIVNLDLHVLETLCKDIHNYRNMGHNIVPASCNLSRRDFELEDLEQRIIGIIKKYNVKTEDIVIEVTETTNLEENERLSRFITTMNKNGILTSVDDFGTGYSSLSVLRDFKVNEIKIDRSFINRRHLSASDEIILGSIIDMAKRLNISVICEGVETKEQADFLLKLGCNRAQGFLYSKALPKLEFEALLQKNRNK